jgi:hypothetical protein
MMFKDLTPEEFVNFQDYAKNNAPPNMAHWEIYHPVCREVWIARDIYPHDYPRVGVCLWPMEAHTCKDCETL